MGIGMGALIAGLFGMNVNFLLVFLRCLRPLTNLPSAYESHGRAPIRLYGYVRRIEFHCISRCMGWSSKVRFLIPLGRFYSASWILPLIRLAKIQKVGLSASNGRKSARGLPLPVRQRHPESRP